MSLETELSILNSQVRQLLLYLKDGTLPQVDTNVNQESVAETEITDVPSSGLLDDVSADNSLDLTETSIEWDNLDIMGCPFHPMIMSSSRKKATTGKMKGCWNKIRSAEYPENMYLEDRRQLIAAAEARGESAQIVHTEPEPDTPETAVIPPAAAPTAPPTAPSVAPPVAPAPTAAVEPINDPNATFVQVCERHIAKYGEDQVNLRLKQCGIPLPYDFHGLEADESIDPQQKAEVIAWIRMELIKHDAEQSQ